MHAIHLQPGRAAAGAVLLAGVLAGLAHADVQYGEAEVVDVEPIRERIEVRVPEQHCWFEHRPVERHQSTGHSATAPLVGGLIGGAIGNAVGHKKRNKQVGAVVGALLGGSIAYDVSRRHQREVDAGRYVRRQEICETVEKTRVEERIAGYLVTYRYLGQLHRTRMAQEPGSSIRVRVQVGPA